jgi:hypothetical protein
MVQMSEYRYCGGRVLSEDEMTAIRHLVWIRHALGGADSVVAYMAAMLILHIEAGAQTHGHSERRTGGQLNLRAGVWSDLGSVI